MKTLGLALVVLSVGCVSVTAKKAPGVSLSQYRTFNFYPTPANDVASIDRSPAAQAVKQRISEDLQQRGLQPSDHPDLWVATHMKVRERYDVLDYGPAWGYGWGWYGGYYGGVSSWTEGTIVIDLIDSHTNQVVWRGTASSAVSHPDNPDPQKAASAASKVLGRLPTEFAAGYAPARM
jgi:hypothetical protein